MKIALFLATKKGYFCLLKLIENKEKSNIAFVTSFNESNVDKDYEPDIKSLCINHSIKYYHWKDIRLSLSNVIIDHNVSLSFAIGWKFIISSIINEITTHGLIVFHDSLLPKYRGFAPTATAIICGEKTIGVSAIQAGNNADEGDIILQKEMNISDDEYISDIINRQCSIYYEMLIEIINKAAKNSLSFMKQDDSKATFSLWRNPSDCHIDWSKSSVEIRNLIRAVASPFPGAYSFYKGEKIIINRATLLPDLTFAIRDYGKLWNVNGFEASVVCGSGLLQINSASYENGTPVIFDRLREKLC